MIFSHGLGGSRNAYSYTAGALASHGTVVICPEHRDGSAIASFVRLPTQSKKKDVLNSARRVVPYLRISHDVCPEVYEAREAQLRIRLWEMGLVHQALLVIDGGNKVQNLNTSALSLDQFIGQLHVHEPGSVIFGGHSFGASTTVQFLKSVYYADEPTIKAMENPLYQPDLDSKIRSQVTEGTPMMLLDMWCLPLLAPNSAPLFNLPLPVYADVPSAPGGNGVLVVESESFFKWTEHLHVKARFLSPDPTTKVVTSQLFERPNGARLAEPNFFYVVNSVHLSQSDFGVLFPWLTKKIFDSEQPERALRLNLRAQLQFLRTNNVSVSRTYTGDLVDGAHTDQTDVVGKKEMQDNVEVDGLNDDQAILDRSENNAVAYWKWIDIVGLGEAAEGEKGKSAGEQVEEGEEKMKGELEPAERSRPPMGRSKSSMSVISMMSTRSKKSKKSRKGSIIRMAAA